MKLAVLKETFPGERRVAIVPAAVEPLRKIGHQVLVEAGRASRRATLTRITSKSVRRSSANPIVTQPMCWPRCDPWEQISRVLAEEFAKYRTGQIVIGTCDPLGEIEYIQRAAEIGISLLALEMIPRITRAQSMDVLSSMGTVAGYRAVILAAAELPKMFPLMMTAAGTLSPAAFS